MNTTQNFLSLARSVVALESHWTQGAFARDQNKKPTSTMLSEAFSFCALGAMRRAQHSLPYSASAFGPAQVYLNRAANALFPDRCGILYADCALPDAESVALVNDHILTTHADVLAIFDKAIELAATGEHP